MAKTCIVNRNKEDKIESVLVRDPNQSTEDGLINFAIDRNNGHSLDKTPNGKESILYKTYVDELGLSDKEAMIEVAKVYTDDFIYKFGNWIENAIPNKTNGLSKIDNVLLKLEKEGILKKEC